MASEHFYQVNLKASAPLVPRFYLARVDNKVQGTQLAVLQSMLAMTK